VIGSREGGRQIFALTSCCSSKTWVEVIHLIYSCHKCQFSRLKDFMMVKLGFASDVHECSARFFFPRLGSDRACSLVDSCSRCHRKRRNGTFCLREK
jgi:hypothetical protein